MYELLERVSIARSMAEVFAFVGDYSHDPLWRAKVTEMRQEPVGPAHLGTTTREVIRAFGRDFVTSARIVAHEPGRRIDFASTAGPIAARGYRLVEPSSVGATFTYYLTIAPVGLFAAFAPLLLRDLRRAARGDLQRLKALLERDVSGLQCLVPVDRAAR